MASDKTLCHGRSSAGSSRQCSQAAKESKPAGTPKPPAPAAKAPEPATPPPPPPTEKSGGGVFLKLLGLTTVGAGGACGYAWYDPNFRKQIETNVPYSKEALDAIIGPEKPVKVPPPKQTTSLGQGGPMIADVEQVKAQSLQRKRTDSKVEEKHEASSPVLVPSPPVVDSDQKKTEEEKPAEQLSAKELQALKKEEAKKVAEEKKRQEQQKARRALVEREAEEAAENAALEAVLKAVLSETDEVVQKAVDAKNKAAASVREHNMQLKKAMDLSDDSKEKETQWQSVNAAFQARQDALEVIDGLEETSRLHLEKVRQAVKDGKETAITKKNKILVESQEAINALENNLTTAQREVGKALSESKIMQEFKDLVKKGRDQFKKELESIKPDVILRKKGGRLTEAEIKEELNLLIAHAHRRIDQLQCQLAEYQSLEQLHISTALGKQRDEDERLAQEMVKAERTRLGSMHAVDKDKWDSAAQVEYERELRQQLTRQAAAHSDHLAEVLKVQENELHGQYQLHLQEQLRKERDSFHTEVAGWIARLQGIEHAVEGRADLEKIGRKAQEMWLACQALSTSIVMGRGGDDEAALKPLANDLMAVRDAGNHHPFVESVVASVPEEAAVRGVWTEEALVDRFLKVYRVGRRTAMIDETGGSLFRFLLSYLQAIFVFSAAKPIPDDELVDAAALDAFTLLDNAKRCLDGGDLEKAIRYMNQLKGEPRRVAADWIHDARLLLEARQAADALLAHASAHGLGSLY